jgi:hypothetical protein
MIRHIELNDVIGNRTRDLPDCSIASQQTTLPHIYIHGLLNGLQVMQLATNYLKFGTNYLKIGTNYLKSGTNYLKML